MNPMTVPTTPRTLLHLVLSCSIWVGPTALLLTPLTPSAQTPAPPAGGYPSADQLQAASTRGRLIGIDTAYSERIEVNGKFADAPKDLLRDKLDDYVKEHGSQWSEAEKEVFSEAYWNGAKAQNASFGNMKSVQPDLAPSNTPTPITTVSGKTPTPGSGTLQLTDKDGNSYFVDVDANGNYKKTIPQANFQPVKATLWTKNGKLERVVRSDGTWTQVSSAAGTSQDAMASGGTAAYALLDECNRAVLMASLASEPQTMSDRPDDVPPRSRSSIYLTRLFSGPRPIPNRPKPPVHRVNDPLPPEAVREAQRQGIDHADQQFEKMQIEKIPKASRTPAQNERLNKLNDMLKDYDNAKNSPFANKEAIDISEKAAQARWLQRQAQALRASGAPGSAQSAQNLENQAKQLLGGQDLPPLRASAQEPLQFSSAQRQGEATGQGTRLVAAGQSGYAMLGSLVPQTSGQTSIKGHSTLVATGDIKKQTESQLLLEPLAHLEEEPSATEYFEEYLGFHLTNWSWGKPNLSLAPEWSASDAKPSDITPIGTNGEFTFASWTPSPKTCYKLNVSYGYDHVSTAISPQTARTYEVTFNANPSWVAAFKPGLDINRFQRDYMTAGQIGGAQYTWTYWHTPFPDVPMIFGGQISDAGYNHLSWESPHKNFMVYGELNPGTNPLPVPGLTPADWPKGAANSLPVLILTGTWIKE